METISSRIMELIDILNMSKSEFARRINLTPAYISKLGKNPDSVPSDRTIADISREFRVSEEWLRTGAGEPFVDLGENEQLSDLFTHMEFNQDDPVIRMITAAVRSYYKLSDGEKAAVQKLLDNTLADLAQKNAPET